MLTAAWHLLLGLVKKGMITLPPCQAASSKRRKLRPVKQLICGAALPGGDRAFTLLADIDIEHSFQSLHSGHSRMLLWRSLLVPRSWCQTFSAFATLCRCDVNPLITVWRRDPVEASENGAPAWDLHPDYPGSGSYCLHHAPIGLFFPVSWQSAGWWMESE